MNKIISGLVAGLLAVSLAYAQVPAAPAQPAGLAKPAAASDCESNAVSKAGKPLTGAAKAASIKKCEGGSKKAVSANSGCADKAVSKNGKPLAGAAKTSFIKKCEAEAK